MITARRNANYRGCGSIWDNRETAPVGSFAQIRSGCTTCMATSRNGSRTAGNRLMVLTVSTPLETATFVAEAPASGSRSEYESLENGLFLTDVAGPRYHLSRHHKSSIWGRAGSIPTSSASTRNPKPPV